MCAVVPARELRRSFTRQTKKCTIDPKDVHKIIWVDDDDDDVRDLVESFDTAGEKAEGLEELN